MNNHTIQKAMKQYMRTGMVNIRKIQQEEREEHNKTYLTCRWTEHNNETRYCIFLKTPANHEMKIMAIPNEIIDTKGQNFAKKRMELFEEEYQ